MGINVLSLFDGISCGQVALQRAGIKVENYFASEIDKHSIKVTMKNHPNTIQLGDVTKWERWDLPKIDLILAGSPCQGFSVAGFGLNFEDPRSKLFFTFVDILKYVRLSNPNVKFLLENVKMKKEWVDVITSHVEVDPVLINSALVSAQNRQRYYWTNIEGVSQPKDKGIELIDILSDAIVDEKERFAWRGEKYGNLVVKNYNGRNDVRGAAIRNHVVGGVYIRNLNIRNDSKSNAVRGTHFSTNNGVVCGDSYRPLTITEAERLQTLPDGYAEGISPRQIKIALGNAWTVDVIAHILSYYKGN